MRRKLGSAKSPVPARCHGTATLRALTSPRVRGAALVPRSPLLLVHLHRRAAGVGAFPATPSLNLELASSHGGRDDELKGTCSAGVWPDEAGVATGCRLPTEQMGAGKRGPHVQRVFFFWGGGGCLCSGLFCACSGARRGLSGAQRGCPCNHSAELGFVLGARRTCGVPPCGCRGPPRHLRPRWAARRAPRLPRYRRAFGISILCLLFIKRMKPRLRNTDGSGSGGECR